MEEILASIRRIISDDEGGGADRAPPSQGSVDAPPSPVSSPRAPESVASNREKVSRLFGLQRPRPRPAAPGLPKRPASEQQAVDTAAVDRAVGEDRSATKPARAQSAAVGAPDPSPFRPDKHRPLELAGDEDDHEPLPRIVRPEHPREAPQPLVSAATEAAVAGSLEELATAARAAGNRPLATLVEQTLRPMLRSWLDENLPALVERLVREELERISRGHR